MPEGISQPEGPPIAQASLLKAASRGLGITIETNAKLTDEARKQAVAEKYKLTPEQQEEVLRAHRVGEGQPGKDKGPAGVGNYTVHQLGEKLGILEKAGLSKEQRFALAKEGLVGEIEGPPDWWTKVKGFDVEGWRKLDSKDRIVEGAVLAMRHYYDMSNEEREANADNFAAAYEAFAEYAMEGKLFTGKDSRVIAAELKLVRFDEKKLQEYAGDPDPAKKGKVIEALDELDTFEHELAGIKRGYEDFKVKDHPNVEDKPPHASKKEWTKYLNGQTELETKVAAAKQKVIALTDQTFFDKRAKRKEEINREVEGFKKDLAEREKVEEAGGVRVDAEPWEIEARDMEKKLDEKLSLKDKPDLETPEDSRYVGKSVSEINRDVIAKAEGAEEALEWRFRKAESLGVLEDLETRLEEKYQELASALFSRSGESEDEEARRATRTLNIAEVREIIAKESDTDNPNTLPNTSELVAQWRYSGIDVKDYQALSGIRRVYVVRAYDQMYASLSRLYKERILAPQLADGKITKRRFDSFKDYNPGEISGEWNRERHERQMLRGLEAGERALEDKLFYRDRYYLTLTGTTEAQVELGVNNYLTNLLEGAHVYDVQTIMQKMTYLSSAISGRIDALTASGMSKEAAQAALTRINILAENRGEIYVMNFVASHLMMDDAFVPLYEKWGGVIGIEKLEKTLDMNDGLVAPAMLLFLDRKNQLLFQPTGFKGQGLKDIWAQRGLRNKIKDQLAKELVNYQAKKAKPRDMMEQTTWQDYLRTKFEPRVISPEDEVRKAKQAYKDKYDQVKNAESATQEDLDSLIEARMHYAKLQNKYDRLLKQARGAVETTWRVFNVFGESARLGAPSIIMDGKADGKECGDHISIEDVTYYYKFVILDAMAKNGDTPAKMRWRAYQWVKNSGKYPRGVNGIGEPTFTVPTGKFNPTDGKPVTEVVTLVKGLEETGITKEEFKTFMDAAKALREKGYKTVFTSTSAKFGVGAKHTFEEIVKRDEVKPVRDNYIAVYQSSMGIFANPTAMREAGKGRQPFIMKTLKRLDQSGRGKFTALDRAKVGGLPVYAPDGEKAVPVERLKEVFEDAITDSLIFHITARQLARWEATFEPKLDTLGNMVCDDHSNIAGEFSTNRIYYGSQDIPWGVKRLQYLPEYWMTNKRQRVGRGWKLLPFTPLLKSGLAEECDAENLPDLIMNVNKEHIDEPGLKQIAASYKDAQGWRQRGETSVDEQRGETVWSYNDKPSVDLAQYLKVTPSLPTKGSSGGIHLTMDDYINDSDKEGFMKSHPVSKKFRKELVDVTREVLKREAPLDIFLEAQLGYNRDASGSGIGLELGERMHYRKWNWMLSEEKSDERGLQGGLTIGGDAEQFFKFISIRYSWDSKGASILDEAWRQARGTRDAGASDKFPDEAINVF